MALRPRYFKVGDIVWYCDLLARFTYCGLTFMTIDILKEPNSVKIHFNGSSINVRLATKAEVVLYAK